jgi:hypothetical protein
MKIGHFIKKSSYEEIVDEFAGHEPKKQTFKV